MPRQQAAAIALGLLVWTLAGPAVSAQRTLPYPSKKPTAASVAILTQWLDAVTTHAPGEPDAAVAATARMTYEQRFQLTAVISLFVRVLRGDFIAVGDNDDLSSTVIDRTRAVRMRFGPDRFLERAAVLHADAAVFAARFPPAVDDVPGTAWNGLTREPIGRYERPVPLLAVDRLLVDFDGEVRGQTLANWNWPFARSLLDLLLPGDHAGLGGPDAGGFVVAWYHATSAYMFAQGLYAEMRPHLQHAGALFPAQADTLFDRGCLAEIVGLPVHQVLAGGGRVELPSARSTNDEAERLFTRVVDADPSYAEARIRLARLLGLRGRHQEAAAQLDVALALQPAGELAFYAHMFAAREALALARLAAAAGHYQAAATLFPDAQSPILGASEVALLQGDLRTTRAMLEQLGPRTADGADPWWSYALASGRDVVPLMTALHARLGF